ncbi:MAG: Xaa-Pro peptidase family protein [Candidatus Cohnella colombiensis]|uniref:Xaa-Pro peptidase family protein n=1 Tax=Candidatus Cohnella colombiensis TaxID=3121368 RepID=A0AA95EYD8_9BACL|nr:MAG: Xaa-Pro peptidase family protein [Cohnella sp.]
MASLSADEWLIRLAKLQQQLVEASMDGCLITQNVGLFYYTGSMQAGYLFVPQQGEPTYYVRRSLARALAESHVHTVALHTFRSFGLQLVEDFPSLFTDEAGEKEVRVGADLDTMPAQLFLRLVEVLPQVKLIDGSSILRKVRSVKTAYEIERISRAANVVALALEEGLASLHEGMTELELLSRMETVMRLQGHMGLMRMRGYNQEIVTGIVAAAEAAAEPTYFDGPAGGRGLSAAFPKGASQRSISRNEAILIDIGCCIDGYVIDQSRIAVIGQLRPELQAAYDIAVAIIRRSESQLRPGKLPEELYLEALAMAEEAGLSAHFMGFGRDQVKFLGHGIGLEIDEWPVLAKGFQEPLQPGMVIAIEPKFSFPEWGVVGIENTYLITETGFRTLTVSPEQLFEIHA